MSPNASRGVSRSKATVWPEGSSLPGPLRRAEACGGVCSRASRIRLRWRSFSQGVDVMVRTPIGVRRRGRASRRPGPVPSGRGGSSSVGIRRRDMALKTIGTVGVGTDGGNCPDRAASIRSPAAGSAFFPCVIPLSHSLPTSRASVGRKSALVRQGVASFLPTFPPFPGSHALHEREEKIVRRTSANGEIIFSLTGVFPFPVGRVGRVGRFILNHSLRRTCVLPTAFPLVIGVGSCRSG